MPKPLSFKPGTRNRSEEWYEQPDDIRTLEDELEKSERQRQQIGTRRPFGKLRPKLKTPHKRLARAA